MTISNVIIPSYWKLRNVLNIAIIFKMLKELLMVDKSVFIFINSMSGNTYLNSIMLFFSYNTSWLFILFPFIIYNLVNKNWRAFLFLIVLGLLVFVTDFSTYNILKPLFGRLRPCYALPDIAKLVNGCGKKFGFPSNHAANTMAVATAVFFYKGKFWGGILLILALLVGFSRIYLGVHYPLDVFFGFLWGFLITCIFVYFNKIFQGHSSLSRKWALKRF